MTVTVTLPTVLLKPETLMVEGYGVAAPLLGIVISAVFVNRVMLGSVAKVTGGKGLPPS